MKIVITGASSGIGKEFSILLAKRGHDLTLVSNQEKQLIDLKQELSKTSTGKIDYLYLDLSKESSLDKLSLLAKDTDVLINDAGFGLMGDIWELKEKRSEQLIDVNIKALTILSQNFSREMIKSDSGRIINIASSVSYMKAWDMMALYVASKHYVKVFSRSLKIDVQRHSKNVIIQTVFPGAIDTPFYDKETTTKTKNYTPVDVFAKKAIKLLFDKNKSEVVVGKWAKTLRVLSPIVPSKLQSYFFSKAMPK